MRVGDLRVHRDGQVLLLLAQPDAKRFTALVLDGAPSRWLNAGAGQAFPALEAWLRHHTTELA